MLTGPELRGLFKEKDSNSASSHGPSVPIVICFHPPLPYLFFPVCRPGSFVLLESGEKREKQESSVASVSPRVPCRCTNSADSGQQCAASQPFSREDLYLLRAVVFSQSTYNFGFL